MSGLDLVSGVTPEPAADEDVIAEYVRRLLTLGLVVPASRLTAVTAERDEARAALTAHAVFAVLCDVAGASPYDRSSFVAWWSDGCLGDEFRFQGALGFGGKFRSRTWTVDCYSEDENPSRLALIESVNKVLAAVRGDEQ